MLGYILFFLLGSVIGVLGMLFGGQCLSKQKQELLALKKNRIQLEYHRNELANHLLRNMALLEQLIADYRALHKKILQSSDEVMVESVPNYESIMSATIDKKHYQKISNVKNITPPIDYSQEEPFELQQNKAKK